MGAGIGGIAASILISNKVPNLSYTVFERNDTVVGSKPNFSSQILSKMIWLYVFFLLNSAGRVELGRKIATLEFDVMFQLMHTVGAH